MGDRNAIPPAKGKGRPLGAKNKRPKNLLDKLDVVDAYLEEKKMGLKECAAQDPKWYHENFTKPRIPKNVDLKVDGDINVHWQQT